MPAGGADQRAALKHVRRNSTFCVGFRVTRDVFFSPLGGGVSAPVLQMRPRNPSGSFLISDELLPLRRFIGTRLG